MRRVHAFELEDQPWFPQLFRDAGTAYLRFAADHFGQARAMTDLIERLIAETGATEILDLCSGGGGPIVSIARALRDRGIDAPVAMSDLFPSATARARLASDPNPIPDLTYQAEPVDATDTGDRPGLRTMFNAFHHFRPETATRILAGAVAAKRPIAVVEVLQRRVVTVLSAPFILVLTFLLVPLLRPFRFLWLPFTYLVPIIPLFVFWDGLISMLRVYKREELLAMAAAADPDNAFDWRVETIPIPGPIPGLALIGAPNDRP